MDLLLTERQTIGNTLFSMKNKRKDWKLFFKLGITFGYIITSPVYQYCKVKGETVFYIYLDFQNTQVLVLLSG